MTRCPFCNGTGRDEQDPAWQCPHCDGEGTEDVSMLDGSLYPETLDMEAAEREHYERGKDITGCDV